MSYPEFRQEILKVLKEIVPNDICLKSVKAEKANSCVRYGISFSKEEDNFAPTIYLEPFYRSFKNGSKLEQLAEEVYSCYREETVQVPECVHLLESFDSAKPLIFVRMLHIAENTELLKDTPHITFLDFAVMAYFEVESSQIYKGMVLIKKHHIDAWHITEKELLDWAVSNTRRKKETWLRQMSEVLSSIVPEEEKEFLKDVGKDMYVLTNKDKYFGAVQIYFPEVLQNVSNYLSEDFYLLPASIHEWVIITASHVQSKEDLFSMVRDINDYEVSKEEILSYNIYFYSTSSQKIHALEDNRLKNH